MTTSQDAIAFLKSHKDHGVYPADDPARKRKGLLCSRCDVLCEVSFAEWALEPALRAWEAEQREAMAQASEERGRLQRALRAQQEALLPEVRMGANWCGDWEP